MRAMDDGRDPVAEGPAAAARKRGGQPGHGGVSNGDKSEGSFRVPPPCKCGACHGALLKGLNDCRKRVWDMAGSEDLAKLEPLNDGPGAS